ncbi:MAG: SRPBCC domain-containing protein [Nocardioidaceae bacterium]
MYLTQVSGHVRAPRSSVYRALIDPAAIATWRVPADMQSEVHEYDPREGGAFRASLTYDAPTAAGKSAPRTDTYHGTFVRLVPDAIPPQDNETGTRMALANLASLVESESSTR